MKNKIQKFSKGNFRTGRPEVIFEETNLVLIIGEGEVYRGSFIIKSEKRLLTNLSHHSLDICQQIIICDKHQT